MAKDERKKEKDQPEEDPYPDLATALHGEYILFRNNLIGPAAGTGEGKPMDAKTAKSSQRNEKPEGTGA